MIGIYILAIVVGYLLGSIPFGIVFTRLAGAPDIRAIGSGNIGATNVLRTGRKGLAAATLIADLLKGTVAVLVMSWLWGRDAGLAAGVGAFVGHLFPVWLKFKGGKGVATAAGVLIAFDWLLGVLVIAVWLAVAFATRYSSLAALVAAFFAPAAAWYFFGVGPLFAAVAGMGALLVVRHHENIRKLARGEESRIGAKKAQANKEAVS